MPIQEANDSVSPNSAGFSAEGGRAEWLYYCRGTEVAAESEALVGRVEPKGDGRLHRVLPRVHPQYPWMLCTTVNVRGQGTIDEIPSEGDPLVDVKVTAQWRDSEADSLNLPPATPQYLEYVRYDLQATFEAVPYAPWPDLDITMVSGDWKDDTGTTKTFSYATEYLRFVDWPRQPATEFLQFKHGQMVFRTASGNKPNSYPFAGLARIPMRKKVLKAMWYRVPESYVNHTDSYLDRFLWRVNQKAVTFGGETYAPGQLLYAGYAFPRRQNPPFPEEDPLFPGFFFTDKILDIELTFVICRWSDPDAPTPANGNWIAAGHNLEMSAYTRKPHYVSTVPLKPHPTDPTQPDVEDTDLLKQFPKYFSCPMELLFTDPAFAQDIGTLRE